MKIKPIKPITMKAMCEHILRAKILVRRNGSPLTAREIFEYSSTGELSRVFDWYEGAIWELGETASGESVADYFRWKSKKESERGAVSLYWKNVWYDVFFQLTERLQFGGRPWLLDAGA